MNDAHDPLAAGEQARLQRTWTLLGLARDLARDGDWFTADLWGRPVFAQRAGDRIVGFENMCAHRFYPLRRAASGRGPIRCGFHGWTYDASGAAVDIPQCQAVFGRPPAEIKRRLRPIDIGLCGALVFGRLPSARSALGLDDYLGDMGPVLRTLTQGFDSALRIELRSSASWKHNVRMALDDYHIVAVHPRTFGRHGPLHPPFVRYDRLDPHSAFLSSVEGDNQTLASMARDCRAGNYRPIDYRNLLVFPNLIVAQHRALGRWHVLVLLCRAGEDVDGTMLAWIAPLDSAENTTPARRALNRVVDPVRNRVMRYFARQILNEDRAVAEGLQQTERQAGGTLFGKLETRIGWFDAACDALRARPDVSAETPDSIARNPDGE